MNRLAPRGFLGDPPPGVVLRPVVALDIDGTLFDWHDDFLQFAHRWLRGRDEFPPEWWYLPTQSDMARHMKVTKEVYRQIKLAYRQSGLKRDLKPFPGSHALVHNLRKEGAEVWVCTTRPYLRLDNIDPDTQELLLRNRMTVDGVIYGEHKYRDLVQLVGRKRIVGVLDDLPEMVDMAAQELLNAMLIQRHHNQEVWKRTWRDSEVVRWPSLPHLPAAQEWLLAELKEWKARHNV